MIEVTDRAGVARTAKWSIGGSKPTLPTILFHDSSLFPAPSYAELIISRGEGLQIRAARTSEPLVKIHRELLKPLSQQKGPETEPRAEDGYAIVRVGDKVPKEVRDSVDSSSWKMRSK